MSFDTRLFGKPPNNDRMKRQHPTLSSTKAIHHGCDGDISEPSRDPVEKEADSVVGI